MICVCIYIYIYIYIYYVYVIAGTRKGRSERQVQSQVRMQGKVRGCEEKVLPVNKCRRNCSIR